MRSSTRTACRLIAPVLAVGVLGGCALVLSPAGSIQSRRHHPVTPTTTASTATTTTTRAIVPVAVTPPAATFATGNGQLDALLPTLPPVLFEGGAAVHFGYNPLDTCCHAGGYNPEPNDVWIGPSAFATAARMTYVAVHELAHSVHLKTPRAASLTAAVGGAPAVRSGSPWDDSEKVADCVAWVLYPAETAASGITYWSCPAPWRGQVQVALEQ